MAANGPAPNDWSPSSWRTKPIKQAVAYPDPSSLPPVLTRLTQLPPLVTVTEIETLKARLRDAAYGRAFVLQGGDCAELFSYCDADAIDSKLKLLLQMSLVLVWGANRPVVRIARMAGQYAKPRSAPNETVTLPSGETKEVPSFRGDILNAFDVGARTPDPTRLLDAYFHAAATLNHVRAQLASGFADLHGPMDWSLGHVRDPAIQARYADIVERIGDALRFMRTVGADVDDGEGGGGALRTVELFTSHEGLLLEYEEALTREAARPKNAVVAASSPPAANGAATASAPTRDGHNQENERSATAFYALSAHFLWIGDRTRDISGAHVEFFRGVANPVGVKVGPTMAADELVRLLAVVDPDCEPGRVMLITRYGAGKVEEKLPAHIDAVRGSGHVVVWQCDPMHGNTLSTATGIKTRRFGDIFAELAAALRIHRAKGSFLGGVHLELTGEAVTECTGGSEGLDDDDLSLNYTSYCDPRLNEKQALELAFLVAGHYRGEESVGLRRSS